MRWDSTDDRRVYLTYPAVLSGKRRPFAEMTVARPSRFAQLKTQVRTVAKAKDKTVAEIDAWFPPYPAGAFAI